MDLVMKRYVQFIVHLFTVICSIDGNNSNPQKATIEFQITSIIQRLVKLTFQTIVPKYAVRRHTI